MNPEQLELDTLIRQQAAEMARPSRIYHWSRRSVATQLSLDFDVPSPNGGAPMPFVELLVEGVNAFPIATPIHVDATEIPALGVYDLELTETDRLALGDGSWLMTA